MGKGKPDAYPQAILIGIVILAIAGGYGLYAVYYPSANLSRDHAQDLQQIPARSDSSAAAPGSSVNQAGPAEEAGSLCNLSATGPRILVPADTSVPIQDPMPGIRYSLNKSDSGKTIVLGKGDVIEINLGFAPSLAMRWTVPVSGCGIELVNDGIYYTGGDFWNSTGVYRARYKAVTPGTSVLYGKLVFKPDEAGGLLFNLTVIVT